MPQTCPCPSGRQACSRKLVRHQDVDQPQVQRPRDGGGLGLATRQGDHAIRLAQIIQDAADYLVRVSAQRSVSVDVHDQAGDVLLLQGSEAALPGRLSELGLLPPLPSNRAPR